ncbi:extracellular solute-binding protein [uncultured Limnohabitans sp.]|uniref:extracellular solute-binding protein n=1 Tax=uncultured Limnohabitans sp. TaxID=768543 RepID=UPI002613DAC1|nr:extracellular solute-binding protein [uncultured Limnohabitans sp.]
MNKRFLLTALCALTLAACGKKEESPQTPVAAVGTSNAEDKVLNIYNWPDYIAEGMIADFEKESGIKVNYQTFENNEALQAKLIAGSSGYDIVVPGAVFAKSQIEAGLLRPLDKTQIPNLTNLDPAIMAKLDKVDPGNTHLVPWAWSFTTVGINKTKVSKALGNTPMPDNAWDLVFNPTYTSLLKSCGIAYLDSPTEVMPPALHYIGKDAYSADAADHKAAGEMLAKVRKDIRLFSSTMIDDLAGGKACVALGWAGDINIARSRAIENQSGQEIEALLPKTGGLLFFDNLAVPKDAKHPNNAMAFINYFLKPEVSAALTNELSYPTANKASVAQVTPEVGQNKSVFLDEANLQLAVSPSSLSNAARESLTSVYTAFKQGK